MEASYSWYNPDEKILKNPRWQIYGSLGDYRHPLLSLGEIHLKCCVQICAPPYKRNMETPERIHSRDMKGTKSLEYLSYVERPRKLGLFSWKRAIQNSLINVLKLFMTEGKKDGARLLPVVPDDEKRGSGHKLKDMKFHLNIRRTFFSFMRGFTERF